VGLNKEVVGRYEEKRDGSVRHDEKLEG
jgi:MFS transporter, SP family, general alpha glucoside:H+ symporter